MHRQRDFDLILDGDETILSRIIIGLSLHFSLEDGREGRNPSQYDQLGGEVLVMVRGRG